jgi:hypothetical protein
MYSAFLLSLASDPNMSRDGLAVAGFLYGKAGELARVMEGEMFCPCVVCVTDRTDFGKVLLLFCVSSNHSFKISAPLRMVKCCLELIRHS